MAFRFCLTFVWKSAIVEDQENLTMFVDVCRLTLLVAVLLLLSSVIAIKSPYFAFSPIWIMKEGLLM